MMKKLIFSLLLCAITSGLFAYPITPRPLRKLILESELIVDAHVLYIENVDTEDHWNDTRAVLLVNEVIQGKFTKDTLYVYFTPGMICPSPARYSENTNVLAFLDKNEKVGYHTHALSYGSKTLDVESMNIYKMRIQEMQAMISKNKNLSKKEITDWLVTCASEKATRWEGIYELKPSSDFMSYYDQDKKTWEQNHRLNEEEVERLRKAFFSIDTLDYYDLGLVDLVADKKPCEGNLAIAEFLVAEVKVLRNEYHYFLAEILGRIAMVTDRKDLMVLSEEMDSLYFTDEDIELKKNKIIDVFLDTYETR